MKRTKGGRLALALSVAMVATALSMPVSSASKELTSLEEAGEGTSNAVQMGAADAEEEAGSSTISKEKAESLIRQYVNIPEDYVLQRTSYQTNMLTEGKRYEWNMQFQKQVNGKHIGSINASIDADSGQLMSFSSYVDNPSAKPTFPLKVDRKEAQRMAEELIGELAASYQTQLRLDEAYGADTLPPLTGGVVHQLRYERVVNGNLFNGNFIRISIDSEGHLQSFRLVWDDTITFPEAGKTLTMEEAQAALEKAADPELYYILPFNQGMGAAKPYLSYQLQPFAIDAVSGDLLGEDRYYSYRRGEVSADPLTKQPLGSKPETGQLSEKDAIAAVKDGFGLPEGSELVSSSFNDYKDEQTGKPKLQWHLNWVLKKDGKEAGNLYASVDGSTGVVQSFNQYSHHNEVKDGQGVTLERALEKAENTVKEQLPWLTDKLYTVKPDEKQYEYKQPEEIGSYSISFVHKVHGATVQYDYVNVNIDARTGEVRSFEARIADFDYAYSTPRLISESAAVTHWMDVYKPQLTYRLQEQYWLDGQPLPVEKVNLLIASGERVPDDIEKKSTVELVYQLVSRPLEDSVFLDARDGQWRSEETGEATSLDRPRATDIEGHWAEHSLELMVAYKALDLKDGEVRPGAKITRGELIKMLVLARNSGRFASYDGLANKEMSASFNDVSASSAYFAYVESALEQNLIDRGDGNFEPDATVSRDEMAELIVRALGYNPLAEYDHMFKVNFKDADGIANKGQAAIVVGLKIMTLSDGKFLPSKEVTRAEASIAFYRYLQKRAELHEAPLRI
ncbi:S-layer homology domain-containing protein [Paenibacillus chungangensis]|uniref:S-layer homology domain-containing protein n=1 Tax=Paenibacillus chungangensis TaxID=696535 RepID=A0ABW3HK22_9BACL